MSSRKSARLATIAEAATQLPQKDKHLGTITSKKVQDSRNSKKQRTSNVKDASITRQLNRRGRGLKGKEENSKLLKEIPLDVLLEIFRLLEPVDLLHVSRVSKSLHDLLTSNDQSFLWKSTYMNVDQVDRPPLCPDDTNVVFFTNYVYGRHCQLCSSAKVRMIDHDSAFIRLCSKCAGNSLRLEEIKVAQKKKLKLDFGNRKTVAFRVSEWRKRMRRIQLEKLRVTHQLREANILKKLEEEEGYNQADILLIHYWVQSAPHFRKSHELTDSEWRLIRADVLDFLQDVLDNRFILKIESRLQSRISLLESFISRWKLRPTAWWLASSEQIASFIQMVSLDETCTISSADYEEIEPQLRDLIAFWKEETDRYLTTLIPQPSGKGKKKDPNNLLELATTFFKCHWCTEPISYPRILMHRCFRKTAKRKEPHHPPQPSHRDKGDMEDLEGDMCIDGRGPREPRPPKTITPELIFPMLSDYHSLGMRAGAEGVAYDEEASNTARDIIMACGEDPKTATFATMEEKPVRLECLRCSRAMQAKQKSKLNRLIMKWNMAVVHELEDHYDEPPSSEPTWRKVDDPPDLEKVKDAETNTRILKRYQKLLACNHCSYLNDLPTLRLLHIVHTHRIIVNKDTVSDHFSPPLDTPIKMLYPAVKI